MEKQTFVARESELATLDNYMNKALSGQGLVCFITGEAGSGKTTLVTEFARRVQEQHADLAVAVGQSDAQTGAGDAHLPFREVLGQLTGDVEKKVAQGTITKENANRLKNLLLLSSQVLVEVGPDLIGVFVPGATLAAKAGILMAKKVGWMEKLEKLSTKKPAGAGIGSPVVEENQIFEQYANVLCTLADKNPLLVILDDLQWADTASIDLLFRLARRIEGHRILLLGTYRPEDVAIGRAGERHPMDKVLAELKRYYGDTTIDLNQAEQNEGRQFVEALVNSEPNLLGKEFCENLYEHTGGHPLFTIELLRNMQERGFLAKDEQDRWKETPALVWGALPGRVEGVIDERIGRLSQELRRILTVASVEGVDFIAEVVARVENADVRGLVTKLGTELERQHRLVKSSGLRRIENSGQRISLFQFQHNLIQKYLYNQLDEAERSYLHEDIGNGLEDMYGEQVDEIVVQLARHFEQAGIAEKARKYLKQAGDQAADRYAHEEAIDYYNRAIDLTPKNKPDDRFTLLYAREQIFGLKGDREHQKNDLDVLVELARTSGDMQKRIDVTLQRARFAWETSDYPTTISASQGVIHLAEPLKDLKSQVIGHYLWSVAAQYQGDMETGLKQIEQALSLSRTAGFRQLEANCLRALGVITVNQGDYEKARIHLQESLRIYREEGDPRGESKTLNNLGAIFNLQGDYANAIDYYKQALASFHSSGDRKNENLVMGNLGLVCVLQGDLPTAETYFKQSLQTSHVIGDRENEAFAQLNLGDVSTMLGVLESAEGYLRKALVQVREIGLHRDESIVLNKMAHIKYLHGDYSDAMETCEQALKLARDIEEPWCEVLALGNLGVLFDSLGAYPKARENYEAALKIAGSMSLRQEEGDVLANLGLVCHHQGEDQLAFEYCQKAFDIAKELGAKISEASALAHLGEALVGLGKLDMARDAYQRSLEMRSDMGQLHLAVDLWVGLANIAVKQGQLPQAKFFTDELMAFLEKHTPDGIENPMNAYLASYRVHAANQDQMASEILSMAYKLLQERAEKIDDEDLRHSYLENVAVNREIVQEYTKQN